MIQSIALNARLFAAVSLFTSEHRKDYANPILSYVCVRPHRDGAIYVGTNGKALALAYDEKTKLEKELVLPYNKQIITTAKKTDYKESNTLIVKAYDYTDVTWHYHWSVIGKKETVNFEQSANNPDKLGQYPQALNLMPNTDTIALMQFAINPEYLALLNDAKRLVSTDQAVIIKGGDRQIVASIGKRFTALIMPIVYRDGTATDPKQDWI